jgi:hypothetical protein
MALPNSKTSILNLFPELKDGDTSFADFWRSWVISKEFSDDARIFDTYLMSEGERWDQIAENIYGDRELWWVIALFNEVEDPFDIYFQKDLSISRTTLKLPDQENVVRLIDEIRRRRLQFEV